MSSSPRRGETSASRAENHPSNSAENSPRKRNNNPRSSKLVTTTLSTSTSSFEALDAHDPHLNHLASLMFTKTSDWIQGELEATSEEYKLLEQMNRLTATKYSDMHQITGNIAKTMTDLNVKYDELQPYLDQIDQIDESVGKLEEAAFKLDAYSKRLEEKFKSLEKREA